MPELRIRLLPPELREGAPTRLQITAHACTLDRETRVGANGAESWVCCGLGSTRRLFAGDFRESLEFALPVLEERAYEISLRQLGVKPAAYAILGPFRPGEHVWEIEVAPSFLREMPSAPAPGAVPPPKTDPADAPGSGTLTIRVVDATSAELLPRFSLSATALEEGGRRWGRSVKQTQASESRSIDVADGSWQVEVRAEGYRSSRPFAVQSNPGVEVDVGVIAIEPMPRLLVRVREADGTPIPEGSYLHGYFAREDGSFARPSGSDLGDGRFDVRADLPKSLVLCVVEPLSVGRCEQQLTLESWTDGVLVDCTLAPWTDLIVRVQVSPEFRYSTLRIIADRTDEAFSNVRSPSAREDPPTTDGMRTYHLRVGPGEYRVRAEGALFTVEPSTLTIGDNDGTREIELHVR